MYTGKSPDTKNPVIKGKITHSRTLSCMLKRGRFKKRSDVPHVLVSGKHRYLYPLDDDMRKKLLPLMLPYPKRNVVEVKEDTPWHHQGEGGATPTQPLILKNIDK